MYEPLFAITWTTPTTSPSRLTGTIIAALLPRRPGLGQLADVPFAVDVVVRAARPPHDFGDVVEERRLAADDHAALHPSALRG